MSGRGERTGIMVSPGHGAFVTFREYVMKEHRKEICTWRSEKLCPAMPHCGLVRVRPCPREHQRLEESLLGLVVACGRGSVQLIPLWT